MIRYIILLIVISAALGHAYRTTKPERRHKQRFQPVVEYVDDYYPEYEYSGYQRDSDADSKLRPWTVSYWGNLLRKTRLPSLNITNPFTKLFTPYVIKVDFPPGTDPNLQSPQDPNKKKKPQQDYVYVNTDPNEGEPDSPQYFYDPVTQQYYEVVESAAQEYSPENNYYATTFKEDNEFIIDLSGEQTEDITIQTDERDASEESTSDDSEQYILAKSPSPPAKKSKSKHLRRRGGQIRPRPLDWFDQ